MSIQSLIVLSNENKNYLPNLNNQDVVEWYQVTSKKSSSQEQ